MENRAESSIFFWEFSFLEGGYGLHEKKPNATYQAAVG